jgi:predicted enzyme related to lactoylglutathione lyase
LDAGALIRVVASDGEYVPPADIPNVGRFSIVRDPAGAGIALFSGSM